MIPTRVAVFFFFYFTRPGCLLVLGLQEMFLPLFSDLGPES